MGGAWRQRLGSAGERFTERMLVAAGLSVVGRRFRRRGGEIDLVALDAETVVFVEVKLRRHGGLGHALEAVSPRQRRCLARTARTYLREHRTLAHRPVRFDVVALMQRPGGRLSVEWIRDAFRP